MHPIPQEFARHRQELTDAVIEIGYSGLTLESLDKLPDAQRGYGDSSGGASNWKANWLVVGHESLCGDPVFIDAAAPGVPVYTAAHGERTWKPFMVAPSSSSFFEIVRGLSALSKGRETPVKMRSNPISESERREFLSLVGKYFHRGVPEFWILMLGDDS